MCHLLEYVEHGFPNSTSSLTPDLQPYFRFRKDLFAVDGVVLYKDRVVIPPIHRPTILNVLHATHQGTKSMISCAESTVFWPRITVAILHCREKCNDYPFQCVCNDFFDHGGYHYSVLVDRYSNYLIVERDRGGAKGLIDSLKRTFSTFGIPNEMATNEGSEFIQPLPIRTHVGHRPPSFLCGISPLQMPSGDSQNCQNTTRPTHHQQVNSTRTVLGWPCYNIGTPLTRH